MGQKITTAQFYVYGKKRFTRTGWQKAQTSPPYQPPGWLDTVDLAGRVFLVTGANSGIGKELTQFLSRMRAKVYMVCRNVERAESARQDIIRANGEGSGELEVLIGDVSRRSDVVRIIDEFAAKEDKLDGLVCNAGALVDSLTLTSEGVEETFACHLLYGSYLLAKLAKPLLEKAPEPRVVFVSSGGMYNTKFPDWSVATATAPDHKFNGQLAYSYAKRGQVILAEQWAEEAKASGSPIQYVSVHPGWTDTPGVESAFGSSKKYLEPMRTMWQGTEGIAWLCSASKDKIEPGAFYLDRTPQTKHIAGYFMTEGTYTKNTPEEIATMMENLAVWAEKPVPHPSLAAADASGGGK